MTVKQFEIGMDNDADVAVDERLARREAGDLMAGTRLFEHPIHRYWDSAVEKPLEVGDRLPLICAHLRLLSMRR